MVCVVSSDLDRQEHETYIYEIDLTFGSPAVGVVSSENRPSFSYWYEASEITRRQPSNGEIMAVRASLGPISCTLKLRRHLPDPGFSRNSGIVVI